MRAGPHPVIEVFVAFLTLGLTAFGGPVAHLGHFRDAFVVRRRWLDDAHFADLVALCQALPGPASSQVGFAIGVMRGGLVGGVAAFVAFTLPSALLLIAFAAGTDALAGPVGVAVVHGLKLVAVAVVAHALWGMVRTLTPDLPRLAIAALAFMVVTLMAGAAGQVAGIVVGIGLGLLLCSRRPQAPLLDIEARASRTFSLTALSLVAGLLLALPILVQYWPLPELSLFDAFYRAGALVFGGGHVVLPLLEAEVVGRGWASSDDFMAGYGAAQAIPGPLFSFAAYLGAIASGLAHPLVGAGLALLGIFLPGFLLLLGVLPFWTSFRARPSAGAALQGVGAAVVGLLAAAFYEPVWTSAVREWPDLLIAAVGFLLLSVVKWPAWRVVIGVVAAAVAVALTVAA